MVRVMRAPRTKAVARAHCFNCGADIGEKTRFSDPLDDCGDRECVRAARDAFAQERAEAHEQLDHDMGWGE